MYLRYAVAALVRRWVVIALASVLGVTVGFAWYEARQAYTTSTHLLYQVSASLTPERAPAPERFVKTTSQLLLSDDVMAAVGAAQGDGSTAEDIRRATTLSGGTDADVIQVAVSGQRPEQSQRRISALVREAVAAAPNGVAVTKLWTGATMPIISAAVLPLGGAAGALGASLLVLVWAAIRRPVLTPSAVDVPGLETYPTVVDAHIVLAEVRKVLAWVDLRARGEGHEVLLIDLLGRQESGDLAHALHSFERPGLRITLPDALFEAQHRPNGARTALLIAGQGVSNEHEIQSSARAVEGAVDATALVVVGRRK